MSQFREISRVAIETSPSFRWVVMLSLRSILLGADLRLAGFGRQWQEHSISMATRTLHTYYPRET